jgi:hypothetical protein
MSKDFYEWKEKYADSRGIELSTKAQERTKLAAEGSNHRRNEDTGLHSMVAVDNAHSGNHSQASYEHGQAMKHHSTMQDFHNGRKEKKQATAHAQAYHAHKAAHEYHTNI